MSEHIIHKAGDAVEALLWLPLDLKPQHPEDNFPKNWEAKTKGLYVFRNGWNGPDKDIVAQLFLKSEGEGGWQNRDGGAFRLHGLGHEWTHRAPGKGKTRTRWHESVVMLDEKHLNDGGRASLMDYSTDNNTGSGSISADLSLIYQSRTTRETKKGTQFNRLVDRAFRLRTENIVLKPASRASAHFVVSPCSRSGTRRDRRYGKRLPKNQILAVANPSIRSPGNNQSPGKWIHHSPGKRHPLQRPLSARTTRNP